eukprot:TRINITY_DN281_c1_g1_i1.p1 TRINITY_DN281_c1_g1~~TRINITY_DN281_c1_g1_i1.p1  ORF type:complete len:714 (-),score=115.54 TRINITY_DN281_c1_g1_i1:9-2150(-)
MDKSRTANVKVCIRVRPTRPQVGETSDGWIVTDRSITERANPDNMYTFDHVFGSESTTRDIYTKVIRDEIVRQALLGFNGTVFAYGQTGSGKSFTMLGDGTPHGIVPYIATDLFRAIGEDSSRDYLVILSILEIYNEKVRDLLVPEGTDPAGEPHIRESSTRGVYVDNCAKVLVSSMEQLMSLVNTHLEERRATGATAMNEHSSRSHCIVRLDIESYERDTPPADAKPGQHLFSYRSVQDRVRELSVDARGFIQNAVEPSAGFVVRLSHLNMVDLAGSERVGKAQTQGQRKVEGANINKSLSELSLVISKLTDPEPAARLHIPYRNSKLTRILQTALGGNSCTAIICTLSPAELQMEESRSTLQFAKRAKSIKQQIWANEVGDEKGKVVALQGQVSNLKRRVVDFTWRYCAAMLRLQKYKSQRDGETQDVRLKLVSAETENSKLRQQIQALQASLRDFRSDQQNSALVTELQKQVADLQEERRRLRDDNEEQEHLLNELEQVHDEDQAKLQSMAAQLAAKEKRVVSLEKQVREMESELEQATSTMEEKDRQLDQAAVQMEREARKLKAAEEESSALSEEISRLRRGTSRQAYHDDRPAVSVKGLDLSDDGPRVRVKGLDATGESSSRIAELEDQLRQRDAQRDLIIDTKLKKMQDLVVRFHQANSILKQNLTQVCEENRHLKELAYKDGKKGKKIPLAPETPTTGIRQPLRLP